MEISWHYPKTIAQAAKLLSADGMAAHAGGTSLALRRESNPPRGYVDLALLPLDYIKIESGDVEIGALRSFADTAADLMEKDPDSILAKALLSLPPALRNRITIGGSVVFLPPWSDILGPLVALEAEVILAGKNSGTYPVTQFAKEMILREKSIVKCIRYKNAGWKTVYTRAARTCFDYSAFNISFLAIVKSGKVEESRVVVSGCKDKFARLLTVEHELNGKKIEDVNAGSIAMKADAVFLPKKIGSPEYQKRLFLVELERGIEKLLKGE